MLVALIWLIAALVLASAEVLTGDMFLLMLGGGALAAAGTRLRFQRADMGRRAGFPRRVGVVAGRGSPPAADDDLTKGKVCPSRSRRWRVKVRWCSTGCTP